MKKIYFLICYMLMTIFLLSSCVSKQKIIYLQDIDSSLKDQSINYAPTLQKDDVLRITVAAKEMEAVKMFNPTIGRAVNADLTANVQARLFDYLIDENGDITFPLLGTISLEGLTRVQAQDLIETKLQQYVKNPEVEIRIVNYKITVLGEVNRPGTFNIPDNRITLLQAIGLAGDLTIYGKRDNIIILREKNGKQESYRVDITSADFIYSAYYYLNQNDTVIIEPNTAQVQAAGFNRNASLWVSIASLLLSTIVVISNNR